MGQPSASCMQSPDADRRAAASCVPGSRPPARNIHVLYHASHASLCCGDILCLGVPPSACPVHTTCPPFAWACMAAVSAEYLTQTVTAATAFQEISFRPCRPLVSRCEAQRCPAKYSIEPEQGHVTAGARSRSRQPVQQQRTSQGLCPSPAQLSCRAVSSNTQLLWGGSASLLRGSGHRQRPSRSTAGRVL